VRSTGRTFSRKKHGKTVVGAGMGTFLSSIAGRLAYFEDEDERWILERAEKR